MGDTTDAAAEQVLLTREINVAHITAFLCTERGPGLFNLIGELVCGITTFSTKDGAVRKKEDKAKRENKWMSL